MSATITKPQAQRQEPESDFERYQRLAILFNDVNAPTALRVEALDELLHRGWLSVEGYRV